MTAALGVTVADVMVIRPTVLAAEASVATVRAFFADDHKHAALLVDRGGRLVTVVERSDLLDATSRSPARVLGTLSGRTVGPDADPAACSAQLRAAGRRRLAVVDEHGALLGLLCRKRDGSGFCSDAGVQERALSRSAGRPR